MSEPGLMSRIGSWLTRARNFTANLIFVLLVVLFVTVILTSGERIRVPEGAALVLNPTGIVVDKETLGDAIAELLAPESTRRETELAGLLTALETGAGDDRIKTLVLDLTELDFVSTAHAATLGEAIRTFSDAGKEVIAYAHYFTQPQYLVASYADAVYMHPDGQILPIGYEVNRLFFSEMLNKLDINVHIFRVGKYKEFVEPYTRSDMSDEAREANQKLVDGLWRHYSETVTANREIEAQSFESYAEQYSPLLKAAAGDMGRLALEFHLVDELLTPDQTRARIAATVGYAREGEFNGIGYRDYLTARDSDPARSGGANVGVITTQGPIVMGSDGRGVIAADSTVDLIRRARMDDSVSALVLRVNSPGGSAFASELIRQELELTQLAGKPVVVSMSSVAASGGYWIASTANRIFAHPTTITGSIGIFAVIPTFEESLARIGVTSDGVGSSALSGSLDLSSGIAEPMAAVLQASVERGYEQFLNLVARGRDMTPEAVDEIAQGRVWIGSTALELGLVDELGGVGEAVEAAAGLAGLEAYGVKQIEEPLSARAMLLKQLGESVEIDLFPEPPQVFALLERGASLIRLLDDPSHRYALCEACTVSW
jgi:protease-4